MCHLNFQNFRVKLLDSKHLRFNFTDIYDDVLYKYVKLHFYLMRKVIKSMRKFIKSMCELFKSMRKVFKSM